MDDTHLAGHCPRCGRTLPPDTAEGLCASCLFSAAAETLTQTTAGGARADAPTVLAGGATPPPAAGDGPRLPEGHQLGTYRIGRLLGRGGMGEVYEAEHQETGRRVALKVLRARLQDSEDRARFLYEGRLAASVSHPHTVYIYGSEEIAGLSIITMELLPGGTLKDLVTARGPLPPHEAVGAILDLIGGLDAAQGAGILHRDIKPSNCFVDVDGTVKVGDFGLSISTLARDASLATSTGFQGTPQFAAPEQLLGKPLDVRADIYAVGATLFYLLTGEAPFDARDLRELVTRVTTETPRSPRVLQGRIPPALAQVVLECLAKEPAGRPSTYALLAELLRPFAASAAQPARPGLRIVAGIIDSLVIALPFAVQAALTSEVAAPGVRFSSRPVASLLTIATGLLYYLALEGRWSASLGKRLAGLRVVGTTGVASFGQIVTRTLAFYAPAVPALAVTLAVPRETLALFVTRHPVLGLLLSLCTVLLTASLFLTMRRRNGFAAVHDLASGTRVVMRPQAVSRERVSGGSPPVVAGRSLGGVRCGPFEIQGDLGAASAGRLLRGFDPVLRRPVWVHAVPSGTPAIDPVRRDLARPTRLRWLTGRRGAAENWDAFEAPEGTALARMPAAGREWRQVKTWLSDLAAELVAGERDRTLPPLRLDHLWIREDGRLVFLDFPPSPSPAEAPTAVEPMPAVRLLAAVADAGLRGGAIAPASAPPVIPLSVNGLLGRWRTGLGGTPAAAAGELAAVINVPDRVQTWRRALPVALLALPIVLAAAGSMAAIPAFRAMTTADRFEIYQLLAIVGEYEKKGTAFRTPEQIEATEIYLAGRHRDDMLNPAAFGDSSISTQFSRLAPIAQRIATARPKVSVEAASAARERISKDLEAIARAYEKAAAQVDRGATVMVVLLVSIAGAFSVIVALLSAAAVPGGVMLRMAGLAAVTRDGVEITRLRSVARWLVGSSPLLVWFAWLGRHSMNDLSAMAISPLLPLVPVLVALAAGAAWAVLRPSRAFQDRIAGVWIVPR